MKKNMVALAVAASCAASVSVEAANFSTRIIGGTQAQPTAYPWMASLRDSGGQFCGASLVNESWLMTAAHCVEDMSAARIHAVVGDFDLTQTDDGELKRGVKRIVIHPQRNAANDDHDIAMVELDSAVSKTLVQPASVSVDAGVAAGTNLTVMGWGLTSEYGSGSDQLREVQVPLVDQAQCRSQLGNGVTDNMICAGAPEGGLDSCQGDSGGPLVHQVDGQWHQLGIVSWGEGCAQPNSPGVYARVSAYTDWINGVIAGTATGNEPSPGTGGGGFDWGDDWNDDGGDEADWGWGGEETQAYELPYWLDFYSEGDQPVIETLSLVNTTDAPISVTAVTANNDSFTVSNNACTAQLAAGESCDIELSYTPVAGEEFQYAELSVTVDDGEPEIVELFGMPDWEDEFDMDQEQAFGLPYWLEFYSHDEKPVERVLRFLNTTDAAVTLTSVTSSDTSFEVTENGCQASVEPMSFCEITLVYTPAQDQTMSEAMLELTTETGETLEVELYGENLQAMPDFGFGEEDWFSDGDAWNFSDDGQMCSLLNSAVTEGDSSMVEAEFTGPGTLSFDFALENDDEQNRLMYLVDGKPVRTLQGAAKSGTQHQTTLSEGKHKVTWVYQKKAESSGEAQVRNLSFTPASSSNTESSSGSSDSAGGGAAGLWFGLLALMGLGMRIRRK